MHQKTQCTVDQRVSVELQNWIPHRTRKARSGHKPEESEQTVDTTPAASSLFSEEHFTAPGVPARPQRTNQKPKWMGNYDTDFWSNHCKCNMNSPLEQEEWWTWHLKLDQTLYCSLNNLSCVYFFPCNRSIKYVFVWKKMRSLWTTGSQFEKKISEGQIQN